MARERLGGAATLLQPVAVCRVRAGSGVGCVSVGFRLQGANIDHGFRLTTAVLFSYTIVRRGAEIGRACIIRFMDIEETPSVLTGIDVLLRDDFALLAGARVGLITNHTGLDRHGQATADLLHKAPGVDLVALFGPEHGVRGAWDAPVPDSQDEATGLPVFSLYGARYQPTPEMLQGVDTLVFDIQDVGCRFYTYLSTLGHCLEAAAKHGLRFVVLDRPNPINGSAAEGPLADDTRLGFTAFHPLPVRHGMTLGELAILLISERGWDVALVVVKCENWKRADWWDATGLRWTNPSPNMRSLAQATLYPGVGLLETTNVSVGRGTDTPFEVLGAPWIDERTLAHALNHKNLPGVRFIPVRFIPQVSVWAGEPCGGVNLLVVDRNKFVPVRTGLEIALSLRTLYLEAWQASKFINLLASRTAMDGLLAGENYPALAKRWAPDLRAFSQVRANFLLYK